MGLQDSTDQPQISLAYMPPTQRQTWTAFAGAAVLLLGLAAFAPIAGNPLPHVHGFIPALDAIIFVTDLITAGLLLAHFSISRLRALLALACGYLFSVPIVVAHALSFPGAFSPMGNLGGSSQTTIRLYLFWHLGLPAAVFVYVWLKDEDCAKATARQPAVLAAICSVAGVLAMASCVVWLAAAGDQFLPSALVDPVGPGPVVPWLIALTMLICAAAIFVLWRTRRSALDQWLMIVVLSSIVEVAITALLGGTRFTLGFYTGRVFSLVTSTVVLTALLAETTRLYARLARANMLASVVKASQALSSEIELPKLIERLLTIAFETAGADRGILILPTGGEYLIQAEARATGNGVKVLIRREPITRTTCPEALVRYVIRTKQSVTIADTSEPNRFCERDDYLHVRRSKSILCLPLLKQRELTGILLLENTLTSYSFTSARIAVVELLAAQAAISLENTRLYSDLQERETKVRRLVESNIIGISIGTFDGQVLEANQAFLQMVGYGQADVESGRLRRTELTPAEWHDRDAQALVELATIGTAQPYEKEYFRKDGIRVPVLIGEATFDERGGTVAFVVDLTERKRSEAGARESERRYREIQAALTHAGRVATMGLITASIAHEVSQPVSGAITNAHTALRWLSVPVPGIREAKQALDRIIRDGNRAREVIERIRALARKAPARKDLVELNGAFREVIELTRSEAIKNDISVRLDLADDLPVVLGDRVQLQQVMLNLVVNAIESMNNAKDGPRELLVTTSTKGLDDVLVVVQDSGTGLAESVFDHSFEAFHTTKPGGLGLGLSISRSIIEAHGGKLRASANVPRGAVFQFTVPATRMGETVLAP
jgi:PAS domain S-box-containing protein